MRDFLQEFWREHAKNVVFWMIFCLTLGTVMWGAAIFLMSCKELP